MCNVQRIFYIYRNGLGGSIRCGSDWWSGGGRFDPCRVKQHSFMEIDHEIFYTFILCLPLILEQLSVSSKRMCARTGLTGLLNSKPTNQYPRNCGYVLNGYKTTLDHVRFPLLSELLMYYHYRYLKDFGPCFGCFVDIHYVHINKVFKTH